jgi:flagellin FlaB
LFSSQQAKEAIYVGVQQSKSTMMLRGNVLANMTAGAVDEIYFTVGTVGQGDRIDLTDTSGGNNTVVISFSDQYQQFASLNWTLNKITSFGDDNVLDENELFQIIVDTSIVNESASSDEEKLGAYHTLVLEVKPPSGAVLTIERTIPPRVSRLVNLY